MTLVSIGLLMRRILGREGHLTPSGREGVFPEDSAWSESWGWAIVDQVSKGSEGFWVKMNSSVSTREETEVVCTQLNVMRFSRDGA